MIKSTTTFICLSCLFLSSNTIEGMKLMKAGEIVDKRVTEKEKKIVYKFQQFMRAVSEKTKIVDTERADEMEIGGGGVELRLADLNGWFTSHPLIILSFMCVRTYSYKRVFFWSAFDTASWNFSLASEVKGSLDQCQWIVMNKHEKSVQQDPLPDLKKFETIVGSIDAANVPKGFRDQFYGKDNANLSVNRWFEDFSKYEKIGMAISAIVLIAVVGIGIFFCLKKTNKKKTEKSEK